MEQIMTEAVSGDLFAVDKRLSLKPIVDFNKYVASAFGDGACTCLRCKDNEGITDSYERQHTFEIGGKTVNRRSAMTSGTDVQVALKKAWKSFYKEDLKVGDQVDSSRVGDFLDPLLHEQYRILIIESRAAQQNVVEGTVTLIDCSD